MKEFMGNDFMLDSPTALKLYDMCKDLPIIDYHCHLVPKEIWENPSFENITQLWLNGDHYKWRLMRACGVEEKYITGDGSDYDKFFHFAKIMPLCIGNPVYHWAHLELQRYFGVTLTLCEKNAKAIWDAVCEKMANGVNTVRGFIETSNVETVCTTDDPADSLEYHIALKNEGKFKVNVYPAFRPDKAYGLEKDDYPEYIAKLSAASGVDIKDAQTLVEALLNRIDFFHANGCRASDHASMGLPYNPCTADEADRIVADRLAGKKVCQASCDKIFTFVMARLARKYNELGWIMQLHMSAIRNNNSMSFKELGPDTGFDAVFDAHISSNMSAFLDSLQGEVPKTVLYSLNPNDFYVLTTLMGCFQKAGERGHMQLGAPWWFIDHYNGMTQQMNTLADLGVLGNFIGMLTDSRSFLSYPRHEYFRRIMCNLIGDWVEKGLYPNDDEMLKEIVQGISYYNVKNYTGL
ncbi:MAG: glucuronate isomerase [Christensenellales bacterium]|jgi:glucuronate isomerase